MDQGLIFQDNKDAGELTPKAAPTLAMASGVGKELGKHVFMHRR